MAAGYVLDASALLAFLLKEPGGDTIARVLEDGAAMSAVNWSEVLSKVADTGGDPDAIAAQLDRAGLLGDALNIVPLTMSDGSAIARLRPATREHGLELGDRACLALAERLGLPALTMDRAWAELDLGVAVELARP